jgi:hypothetical protein
MAGPQGISRVLTNTASWLSRVQSGYIYHYALIFFIFITIFLTVVGYKEYCSLSSELLIILPIVFYIYYQNNTK